MAIRVKHYEKQYEYIPLEDRNSENPTVFVFRRLSHEEMAKLEDNLITMYQDQSVTIKNASYLLNVIRLALVDVKNLLDENGKEIKLTFDDEGLVSSDFIELLPSDLLLELGSTIANVSKFPNMADVYLGKIEPNEEKKAKRTRKKSSE